MFCNNKYYNVIAIKEVSIYVFCVAYNCKWDKTRPLNIRTFT